MTLLWWYFKLSSTVWYVHWLRYCCRSFAACFVLGEQRRGIVNQQTYQVYYLNPLCSTIIIVEIHRCLKSYNMAPEGQHELLVSYLWKSGLHCAYLRGFMEVEVLKDGYPLSSCFPAANLTSMGTPTSIEYIMRGRGPSYGWEFCLLLSWSVFLSLLQGFHSSVHGIIVMSCQKCVLVFYYVW